MSASTAKRNAAAKKVVYKPVLPKPVASKLGKPTPNIFAGIGSPTGAMIGQAPAAAPAPPSKPVDPFLNPDQLVQTNDYETNYRNAIADMEAAFSKLTADTRFQAGDVDAATHKQDHQGLLYQNMVKDRDAADSSLVARGLFQSSIRDGDLADIEATTAARRQSMLDSLSLQSAANDRRRSNLDEGLRNFRNAMNQAAVQNAQAVPVTPSPAATPAAGASTSRPATATSPGTTGGTLAGTGPPAATYKPPVVPKPILVVPKKGPSNKPKPLPKTHKPAKTVGGGMKAPK